MSSIFLQILFYQVMHPNLFEEKLKTELPRLQLEANAQKPKKT
jgi:hypothetical protein